MALKNLFGKDVQLDKLPAELKPLVEQMRQERMAYDALVKRGEQLKGAIGPLEQQLGELEQRLAGFDKLASQLTEFQKNAAALEAGQRGAQQHVAEVQALAESLGGELGALKGELEEVRAAKADLPQVMELVKPLGALRSEAAAIEQRMEELSGKFDQLRGRHERIAGDGDAAVQRLAAMEESLKTAAARVDDFTTRTAGLQGTVEQLQHLLKEVPDVKRELSTLNVLAEYVTRKVATIESQKDMVERTTQRAERLTELTTQVDRQLQDQHENAKFLDRVEKNVEEIKKLHEAALERAEEIERKYKGIDTEGRKLAEDFARQRDALQQAAGNFKFDRDGLEALSQRIGELRTTVGGVEQQLPALEETRRGLVAAASDVKRLGGVVQELTGQIARAESAATDVQAAQGQVRQLREEVGELARRMEAFAPGRLSEELDERVRQLEDVRSRVARLQADLAGWEVMEERTSQALQVADERRRLAESMRADLQRVFEVADATVQQVRAVVELQQQIDQRQQALDPVLEKLRSLERQGAALEERQKQFTEAEQRLARLDALLIDLQSTFQTVLDQKEFLERVVETAGNLALQTMQAEAVIATLREATGKRAKA